jgi:hypothetical protein
MKTLMLFVVLMLVGIVTTAHATQTVKCVSNKASCPNTTLNAGCTFRDSQGNMREGTVVNWKQRGYFGCQGVTAPPPKPSTNRTPNATFVNKIPSNAGGTDAAPAKYEGQVLHKNRAVTEDVIRGKVELKPQIAIVVLRDSETKRIIDMTTTDSSGNFIFENMTFRQGLELGWASPQEIGEPDDDDDEGFCYRRLADDPAPPLKPMECDDTVLESEAV